MINEKNIVFKAINDSFDRLDSNNFAVLGRKNDPMWERPLIGVAAGDDPYYGFLKEHIGAFHWLPTEAFGQKYADVPDAKKLSVVSIAFPQTMATKAMQARESAFPCDNWVVSRGEWEPLMDQFCRQLEQELEKSGIRSVCPDLLSGLTWMHTDRMGWVSNWSLRHTAYAAGLGTFGLSDGLITKKGIAVRFSSLIVEAELPASGKVSEDPYGWCDKCGTCIRRCPINAISMEKGHDKDLCSDYEDYLFENHWPQHIEKGEYLTTGCGFCQTDVPCCDHPPFLDRITYQIIRPSYNAAIAKLVRSSLKNHELDIPGTAYYDPNLDDLCSYYHEVPGKRQYYVAVDERGEVIGGCGIDSFDDLPGCAELQKLYVSEKYQRLGVGKTLVNMIEAEAQRLGYSRLYLETHSNLQAAMLFYENAGFVRVERPAYCVHDTMDVFMLKEL